MSAASVDVVRRLFELFERGGFEAALDLVSEDFLIVIPPSMSAEPDLYEGHEGVRRYFGSFEGMLEDVRYEALDLIDEGDAVIAPIRLAGRGATSGIEVELRGASVHWVEDGKVTRVEAYPDFEAARDALSR